MHCNLVNFLLFRVQLFSRVSVLLASSTCTFLSRHKHYMMKEEKKKTKKKNSNLYIHNVYYTYILVKRGKMTTVKRINVKGASSIVRSKEKKERSSLSFFFFICIKIRNTPVYNYLSLSLSFSISYVINIGVCVCACAEQERRHTE
jgi:hypothetical protein